MYFKSLQTFRGIFALMIFFHHFNFRQPNGGGMFSVGGDFGVAFFFILSGFVLSQSFHQKEPLSLRRTTILNFILKRISKIYPLHVLCFFIANYLQLPSSIIDWSNLFLLQSWVPIKKWYFSGNAVGWCLSDFLFFYALFPYVSYLYVKYKQKFIKWFCALVCIYILIIPLIPTKLEDGLIYINPLSRSLDFIFGIVISWIYNQIKGISNFISLIDVLTVSALSIAIWYIYPSKYNLSLLWWPSVALILLYSVTTYNRFLSFRPFVKFGDVSFSFYLIHVLAKKGFDIVLKDLGLTFIDPHIRLIIILTLTIFAAFIVHKYYVLPIEKYIRKHLKTHKY